MTDNKNKKPGLLRYKLAALIGTIIMAIGAFMACLCVTPAYITVGNVLLIVSIVVMVYGYSHNAKNASGAFRLPRRPCDRRHSLRLASM